MCCCLDTHRICHVFHEKICVFSCVTIIAKGFLMISYIIINSVNCISKPNVLIDDSTICSIMNQFLMK